MDNQLSAQITPEDQQAVLDAIATIRTKLPFLLDLSLDERKSLPKLGDKSRAFVSTALQIASQNENFLPRDFDVAEMRKDLALFEALQPIRLALLQLAELVDDTTTLAGSEAYSAALVIYTYAKTSGKSNALDGTLDELGRRFARKFKAPNTP